MPKALSVAKLESGESAEITVSEGKCIRRDWGRKLLGGGSREEPAGTLIWDSNIFKWHQSRDSRIIHSAAVAFLGQAGDTAAVRGTAPPVCPAQHFPTLTMPAVPSPLTWEIQLFHNGFPPEVNF